MLKNISIDIPEATSVAIIGGSGTGKSVLIKNVIGLLNPDQGQILVDATDITKLSLTDKASYMAKCGFLFQGGALFDSLNILDNVTFYPAQHNSYSKGELMDLAAEKLKEVGLNPDIMFLYPAELSGGMQKRVALARAIVSNPQIIFFDEPTTGLDPVMANVISNLIRETSNKLKATTITITHDMNCVGIIADYIAMLYQGEIIWQGSKDELKACENPIIRQFIAGNTTGPITTN